MKKIFKAFFVIAAAALTLAGCQKKEIEQPQNAGEYKYSFAIVDETRAIIGDNNIEWVSGDRVGMFVGDYKGYANVDVTTTPKMVVLYSNNAIPAGTMAYAYAPYDEENKTGEPTNVKIVLNNIQSGAEVSAMPLAGLPFEVEEEIDPKAQEGNGQIKFMNLGSVINFKIFSTNEEFQSETIQYIQFEANKAIAGTGHIDLTAVDMDDESSLELVMDADENTVKVNEEMAVAADKEAAEPIKMIILPGTFEGTLTVVTDVATYTKAIPERAFARSHSRTFGLDLAKAERTEGVEEIVKPLPYEEAFTTGQGEFKIQNVLLPEGVTNLWVFDSSYGAKVTAYDGSNNHAAETLLVSPWIDLTEVAGAAVSFDHAGNYFSNAAAIQNECTLWAMSDEEGAEWEQLTIGKYFSNWTFVNSGEISLGDYVGKKVKVAFKYTSTATKSGTWEIKNFSAHVVKVDPELSFATTEFEVLIGDDFTAPTLVNPHGVTVTYSSSNEEVALVDENTGEVVLGETEGFATITASFPGNDVYTEGSASYLISLSDPNSTSVFDRLTLATTGVEGTNYVAWSGKKVSSEAVYAGLSAGGNESIQLRSNDNKSGIITTASGGTLKSISVSWNSNTQSGRVLNVYGKNTAYSSTADLYSDNTAGVLIGTIVCGTSTTLSVSDTYKYIGLRSASGAMYLTDITIEWSTTAIVVTEYDVTVNSSNNGTVTANPAKAAAGTEIVLTVSPEEGYVLSNLTVDDEDVTASVSDNEYSFAMPAHNVTVEATFAPGQSQNTTWVKTAYSSLATGDVVIIVDETSKTAMSNDKGTSNPPAAVAVTISEDGTTLTKTPGENLQWTVTVSNGSYTFGTGDSHLYCTATNNGVRVGSNANSAFTFEDDEDGNPFLKNTATSRYVGVYNTQDWRCYTSINNNIADTRVVFYKQTTE